MLIFCKVCKGERPATKKYGPLPNGTRPGYFNVCDRCGTKYATIPPASAAVRRNLRAYMRASGQRELCR